MCSSTKQAVERAQHHVNVQLYISERGSHISCMRLTKLETDISYVVSVVLTALGMASCGSLNGQHGPVSQRIVATRLSVTEDSSYTAQCHKG
jgi:hypothetical protein